MKNIIFTFIILFSLSSWAYIPNPDMILKRTSENHGSGIYLIDLEVVIPSEPRPLFLKEQWMVKDGKQMRVRVSGLKELKDKVSFTYIYNYGKKYFIDSNGVKKSVGKKTEWSEGFLHYRTQNYLKGFFIAQKIVPRSIFRLQNDNEKSYVSDSPYLRLSRQNGKINYLFNDPAEVGSSEIKPAVWIEQDNFVISKIRYPSGFSFSAEKFSRNSGGLWFPQKRAFSWGEKSAFVQTIKVRRISSSAKNKKRVSHYSLNVKKEPELKMNMPNIQDLQEFYTTFR